MNSLEPSPQDPGAEGPARPARAVSGLPIVHDLPPFIAMILGPYAYAYTPYRPAAQSPAEKRRRGRTLRPRRLAGHRCIGCVYLDRLIVRRARLLPRTLTPRRRLAGLVYLARLATGAAVREPFGALLRGPHERLVDELTERLERLDPGALRLPPFALVQEVGRDPALAPPKGPPPEAVARYGWRRGHVPRGRRQITDPARALALVSRRSGSLFIAGRRPSVACLAQTDTLLAFFVPDRPGEPRERSRS